MLEINQLSVSYGRHQALDQVSLRVNPGEIVVILGANGAGKSTLLKAIGGMVPASGQVSIGGRPVMGMTPNKIVEAGLALVPEGRGIFGELSVQENLTLGAYAQRAREAEATNLDRVFSLFPRLTERRSQMARTMSGGEQQMVAIGRAMMSAPDVLMLDEPSLGLSPLLCRDLFKSLQAIRSAGTSVLLVEQNARQSLAIADRAYLLENGHIVGEGAATELARDPAVQKAYLGGAASAAALPARAPEPSDQSTHGAPSDAINTSQPDALVNQALQSVQAQPGASATPAETNIDAASLRALVKEAEQTQTEHIEQLRNGAFDTSVSGLSGTQLSGVVSDIEAIATAARRATGSARPRVHVIRGGSTSASAPASANQDRPDEPASNTEPPAPIEVWRRKTVRVYKRQRPGGPLERVEDSQ